MMPFLPEASTKYSNSSRPDTPDEFFHDAAIGCFSFVVLKCTSVTWVSSITRTPQEAAWRRRSSSNSARTYGRLTFSRCTVRSMKNIRTTFHAPLFGSRAIKSVSAEIVHIKAVWDRGRWTYSLLVCTDSTSRLPQAAFLH